MFTERLSYWSGLALSAAVTVANVSTARAADPVSTQPNQQELLEKINALQSEVQQLKQVTQQQKEQNEETARRVEQSTVSTAKALSSEAVRYDRFGLAPIGGFSANYENGRLVIQSEDKRFTIHPWLQSQFRYAATFRDDAQHGGKDPDTQAGFEVRRHKFGIDGNILVPNLTYAFQWQTDRKTGNTLLEAAYGKYHFSTENPLYLKVGQFKEPLDHEQILASRFLTATDRTLTNDLFSGGEGFVQGASIGYENSGPIRAEFAVTDGARSLNTNFQQFPSGANSADYGVVGRVDYKAFGNWKDYDYSTGAYGTTADFLVFGAAADYTEAGDTHAVTHVLDVDYGSKSGFALYGAFTGRAFSHSTIGSLGATGGTTGTAVGTNGYDYSFRGQVSYALNEKWEPYAQYEYIHLDSNGVPAGIKNNIQILRAGVNYYLYGPIARVSFEAEYLPNGSPVSDDGNGTLATGAATKTSGYSHGGGNEVIFHAQFQLAL